MKTKLLNKNLGNIALPISVSLKKWVAAFLILCTFYSGVQAQITAGFELDGNATAVVPNPPDDWDLIFNNTSSAQITTGVVTDADNIFQGGGSKDDLDINNWGWTTGSVPDKDDILHGGAALYNNCQLYFFADRFAVNGSSNIGFWLFKDSVSVSAGGTFSGLHTVGDLLIVSEFTNGGGVATINAYRWVGTGGSINGTLDPVTLNGTNAFAITNTATVTSPWPYTPKTGPANQFAPGAFFEGGIDLCNIPGLDPCFTSFLIETRSSFAIDAVLKDFMNGSFETSPQITLAGGTRCINGPAVTLSASVSGGVAPLTYLWSPGGNTTSSIVVSPTVTTTYTFTVSGANGCTKHAVATVSVTPSPDVNAGADMTINCITTSAMLTGSSSTQGVTYHWTTIGGNITSVINTPTVTVDAAGTYVLKVTNTEGCTATDTAMVTLNGTPPDVNAGSDKTLTCTATQVTLNGSSSTPGATFMWTATNGGMIISGGTTATPLVQGSGKYILTVTDPQNGCTAKDTADVFNDNTIPDVDAGGDMVLNCVETSIVLDGSSTTAGGTIMWIATNGGNIVSGGTTLNPTVDMAGTYILTITHPTSGCAASDTVVVTGNTTVPNVNAGADVHIGCLTPTVTLHGSSTSNVGFNWTTIGGNIVSGANTANPTVDATGTYILTVIDHINGCSATDTVKVKDDQLLGQDTTVCGCIVLSAYISGATSFVWCDGSTYPTLVVCTTGMYCVTVSNGICVETDTIFITVLPPASVDLGNDTIVMTSLVLDAGNAGATFMWSTGATTQTINVNSTGQYIVTVTIGNGCTDSDTINVNVLNGISENTNSDFDVSIYPNPSTGSGFTLSFNIEEKGNVEIRILNTLGLMVYSEKLENFKGDYLKKIILENCAAGIYVADILKDNIRSTKNIVLSK